MLSCTANDFLLLSCPSFFTRSGLYSHQRQEDVYEKPIFEGREAQFICQRMIDRTKHFYRKLPADDCKRTYSYQGLICRTTWSWQSYLSLYGCCTLLKRTWRLRMVMGIKGLILRLFVYLLVVATTTSLYERNLGKDDGCIILNQPGIIDPKNCTCFETVEEIRYESAVTSNIKLIFFFLLFLSLESLLNVALTFPTEFKVKVSQIFVQPTD